MELFLELKRIGMNGVEGLLRAVDKFHRRRVGRLGEGIDLQTCSEEIAREVRLAVNEESTKNKPVDETGRLGGEVTLGNVTLIVGGKNQVFAALVPVGPWWAGVMIVSGILVL